MLGRLDDDGLVSREVHRFHYPPARVAGHLRWPSSAASSKGSKPASGPRLRRGPEMGTPLETVGVDSLGRGLRAPRRGRPAGRGARSLSRRAHGRRHGARSSRTSRARRSSAAPASSSSLFNTIFQLYAHVREGVPARARRLLMIPDLCHHRALRLGRRRVHQRHHHPAPGRAYRQLGRRPVRPPGTPPRPPAARSRPPGTELGPPAAGAAQGARSRPPSA